MARKSLPPMQARFVDEYIVDLNATQAAKRAGYSPRTAHVIGHLLLKKVLVAAAVDQRLAHRSAKVHISADDVLAALRRLLGSDVRQAFAENGSLKPIHELPDDVALAISSVETDELFDGSGKDRVQVGVVRKVKFWDKTKAAELCARHLGMLRDRTVLENPDGSAIFDGAKSRVRGKLVGS